MTSAYQSHLQLGTLGTDKVRDMEVNLPVPGSDQPIAAQTPPPKVDFNKRIKASLEDSAMLARQILDAHLDKHIDQILGIGAERANGIVNNLPTDVLVQLIWPGIDKSTPIAYTRDTLELLARYPVEREFRRGAGATHEELARYEIKWITTKNFWLGKDLELNGRPKPTWRAGENQERRPAGIRRDTVSSGERKSTRVEVTYKFPQEGSLASRKAWHGHQAKVKDYLLRNPNGGTARDITAGMVAEGFTCNQEPLRAIYFILNDWKKKGWLI